MPTAGDKQEKSEEEEGESDELHGRSNLQMGGAGGLAQEITEGQKQTQ